MYTKMINDAVTSASDGTFFESKPSVEKGILIAWLNMALNDDKEYVVERMNGLICEKNEKVPVL